MKLRRADQHDVAAMVRLQRAGFREALFDLLPGDFQLPDPVESRAALAGVLATDGVVGLVADEAHGLAGSVVFGLNRDEDPTPGAGEIRSLFVEPSRWREGVGRVLVEDACGHLSRLGYSAVTLWSLRDNSRANAFYAQLGFELDGAARVHPTFGAPVTRWARPLR